jgi:ABC-type glycerol-3-phosphate transport system permease component
MTTSAVNPAAHGDVAAHVADKTATVAVHEAGERKHTVRLILGIILRILLCLVFGLPLLFMIISSFKPDLEIFSDLTSIKAFLPVGDLNLDNYTGGFERVPFARFMMVGIDYFKQLNVSWGQIMAYATMITVPMLILFIAFQRSFINSIASSGVKG